MFRWLNEFPNTCFGLTSIHFRSSSKFHDLLSEISPYQIVFESDSPYLGSSSSVICSIANDFAELRHISRSHLLTIVYETTKRLYNIPN